jgi:hypothetical protein
MGGLLYAKCRLGINENRKQETRTSWRKRVSQALPSTTSSRAKICPDNLNDGYPGIRLSSYRFGSHEGKLRCEEFGFYSLLIEVTVLGFPAVIFTKTRSRELGTELASLASERFCARRAA